MESFGRGSVRLSQFYHLASFSTYIQDEKRFRIPPTPQIVDFAVELDNAIYCLKESECTASSSSLSFTLADIEDEAPIPIHTGLFENPEFESFGSSYYTLEEPWTPADLTYNVLSPTPLQVDGGIGDMYDGSATVCDRDSAEPPTDKGRSAGMAAPRVVTEHPPTSSRLFPGTSTFSYPSPASVDEQDITEVTKVEEDYQCDLFVPSSFARPRRVSSGLSMPRAKKQRVSASSFSVSNPSAVRFPCSIPGCKQVCKTLGDLKRHESILTHKPPLWECHRCHYQFTREDALKRHNRNLPNYVNGKTNTRGRPTSMKPQRPDVVREVELA